MNTIIGTFEKLQSLEGVIGIFILLGVIGWLAYSYQRSQLPPE